MLIDRDNQTDEPIYQFFHPSFQEYFAALAVPNWEFLFNHVPGEISEKSSYKIFESDWQEIALMWIDSMESENFSKLDIELTKVINSIDLISGDYSKEDCFQFYSFKIFPFVISVGLKFRNYSGLEDFDLNRLIYWSAHILITNYYWDEEKEQYELEPYCHHGLILSSLKKLPDHLLYDFINAVDENLKSHQNYRNYRFKIIEIMFEIPSKRDFAAEKMFNFLHLNDEMAMKAAQVLLKYDQLFPLSIHKLIDLFYLIKDEKICCKIIDILIETKNINSKTINSQVLKKIFSFLKSKVYNVRRQTILLINKLINFGVLDIVHSDKTFFDFLASTIIINQNNPIIIFKTIELLDKLKINNEMYIKPLIYLACRNREIVIVKKALDCLEKIELSLETIRNLIVLMPYNETVARKYSIFLDFLKNYSLSNPKPFANIDILKYLLLAIGTKYFNNEEENGFMTIEVISHLVLSNNNIFKALKKLQKTSQEEYIVGTAEMILEAVEDKRNHYIQVSNYEASERMPPESKQEMLKEIKNRKDDFKSLLTNEKELTLEVWDNHIYTVQHWLNGDDTEIISQIINIIELTNDSNMRMSCFWTLERIGALSNPDVIHKLINLILITENLATRHEIAICLTQITQLEILNILVANFKNYTADQVRDDDAWLYMASHDIVWHCAQHMSYPEFYYAWNSPALITSSETPKSLPAGNTSTVQVVEEQIRDLGEILKELQPTQKIYPIVINAEPLEGETDNTAIAQELCNQIYQAVFPDDENIPEVNNHSQLKPINS